MTRAEFVAVWDGRLILTTAGRDWRTSPAGSTSPGLWERSTISTSAERGTDRVLPAAVLPGLAAVFPGGIDKVLVHRALST
jgi:hypothetical protein